MYAGHERELKQVLVDQIAKGAAIGPAMKAILKAMRQPYQHVLSKHTDKVKYADDYRELKKWLKSVLAEAPPAENVGTIVFNGGEGDFILMGKRAVPGEKGWKWSGDVNFYRPDIDSDSAFLDAVWKWTMEPSRSKDKRAREFQKKLAQRSKNTPPVAGECDDTMEFYLEQFLNLAYTILVGRRLGQDCAKQLTRSTGERALVVYNDPPVEVGRISDGAWQPATPDKLKIDLELAEPPGGKEESSVDVIDKIVLSGVSPKEGLEKLKRKLAQREPSYVWDIIPKLKLTQDYRRCKEWFGTLLAADGLGDQPAVLVFCIVLPADAAVREVLCDIGLGTGSVGDEQSVLDEKDVWEYVAYKPYRANSEVMTQVYRFGTDDPRAEDVPETHAEPYDVSDAILLAYSGLVVARLCRDFAAKLKRQVTLPCYVRWGYVESHTLLGAITKAGWKPRSARTSALKFKP